MGKTAEAATAHLCHTGLDCVLPRVYWNLTSERVLTMEFKEGSRVTDVESIDGAGICEAVSARPGLWPITDLVFRSFE